MLFVGNITRLVSRRYKITVEASCLTASLMIMRLSVSVGEENYHGAFDDDDPVYEGKKQSSANAWGINCEIVLCSEATFLQVCAPEL